MEYQLVEVPQPPYPAAPPVAPGPPTLSLPPSPVSAEVVAEPASKMPLLDTASASYATPAGSLSLLGMGQKRAALVEPTFKAASPAAAISAAASSSQKVRKPPAKSIPAFLPTTAADTVVRKQPVTTTGIVKKMKTGGATVSVVGKAVDQKLGGGDGGQPTTPTAVVKGETGLDTPTASSSSAVER